MRRSTAPAAVSSFPFHLTPVRRALCSAFAIGGLMLASSMVHAEAPGADAIAAADANGGGEGASLQSVTVTAQKREESAEGTERDHGPRWQGAARTGIVRSASEILNYVAEPSAGNAATWPPPRWDRGVGAGQQQIDFPTLSASTLDDVLTSAIPAPRLSPVRPGPGGSAARPASTLWGKNTTGGAINVISRQPRSSPAATPSLTTAGLDTKLAEGDIGGALVDEVLRRGVCPSTRSSRTRAASSTSLPGERDGNQGQRIRGQLKALIARPDGNLNLHLRDYTTKGATTTVASYGANGVYRNGYIPSTNPDDVRPNAPADSDVKQGGAQLNLEYALGDLTLTSITGYENFRNEATGDSDNTPLEVGRSRSKASSRQVSQELRLTSPQNGAVSWVAGLFYFNEDRSDSAGARLPNAPGRRWGSTHLSSTPTSTGQGAQRGIFAARPSTSANSSCPPLACAGRRKPRTSICSACRPHRIR